MDKHLAHYNEHVDYKSPANNFRIISQKLLPHIKPDTSILDLGCGTGLFCNMATINKRCKTTGVDFAENRIKRAKTNYPELDFRNEDVLEFLLTNDNTYDVITFFEVIEHLQRPAIALDSARLRLNDEGYVLGTVPLNMPYKTHISVYTSIADVELRLNVKVIEKVGRWVIWKTD